VFSCPKAKLGCADGAVDCVKVGVDAHFLCPKSFVVANTWSAATDTLGKSRMERLGKFRDL